MAYLVLMKSDSPDGNYYQGDVISTQDHQPTPTEYLEFDIVEVDGTAETIHQLQESMMPEIKTVWKDGDDWKDIEVAPIQRVKYNGTFFEHNYGRAGSDVVISKDIAVVEAMQAELSASAAVKLKG